MISAQLTATINEELRWREAEMARSKLHLYKSINDTHAFRYAYRCFAMLAYAHFEAFSKRVIAQSIQDICDTGIAWSKCKLSIRSSLFSARLRKLIAGMSNDQLADEGSNETALIDGLDAPDLDIIMSLSNLNFANFTWLVQTIGLDPALFSQSRVFIGRLASLRHGCAHGDELSLDPLKTNEQLADDLLHLSDQASFLMHMLGLEIVDHFAVGGYRLPVVQP
ncbi:MAE_28990/MAE_18760 family HEPN-like nuclease [Sphingomonas sp. WKB10]|nr:MAE_28990/MAE_18760 family HEPN-like nuclease [Sphingomonas sp. WKB10]